MQKQIKNVAEGTELGTNCLLHEALTQRWRLPTLGRRVWTGASLWMRLSSFMNGDPTAVPSAVLHTGKPHLPRLEEDSCPARAQQSAKGLTYCTCTCHRPAWSPRERPRPLSWGERVGGWEEGLALLKKGVFSGKQANDGRWLLFPFREDRALDECPTSTHWIGVTK